MVAITGVTPFGIRHRSDLLAADKAVLHMQGDGFPKIGQGIFVRIALCVASLKLGAVRVVSLGVLLDDGGKSVSGHYRILLPPPVFAVFFLTVHRPTAIRSTSLIVSAKWK